MSFLENVEKMFADFSKNIFSFTLMHEIAESELDDSFHIENDTFYRLDFRIGIIHNYLSL